MDLYYSFILFVVFFAVALLVAAVASLFYNRDAIAARLARLLKQETPDKVKSEKLNLLEDQTEGLSVKISRPLIRLSPADHASKHTSTRLRLMQAGFRSKKAYYNFLACKVTSALLLPGAFMAGMMFLTITPERMLLLLVLALFGYFLPNLVLYMMTQNRKQDLRKALPDALDLMVVCVEAGLGLDMTFKRVGEEIRPISKSLSDEFLLTNLEVRSGQPRQESLKNMSLRAGVPEIHQLMTMLNQTNRFGTSLASALRIHSDSMRVKRRQTAEEIAAKAAIKLLFPLVFFIFPALFVVLLGPAVIRIMRVLLPTMQGG